MVEPDVIVVCDKDKIKDFGIYGAPDFVLEVLSKSTHNKDMTLKLSKYQAAGVLEYWIIDPYKEKLLIYDFSDEDYFPSIHSLEGNVPVAITGGDLEIDLEPIAQAIKEMKERNT
jgi:Uma2 family endonuclease